MADISDQELLRKYRTRSPWKIIGWILVFVVIVGIAAVIFLPGYLDQGSAAEQAEAKAAIRAVVQAAESYRKANDSVYEGITAAKIKGQTGKTIVVDGVPKKGGQVGISDYNSKRLILVYVGKSGIEYVANIEAGNIEFNF